MKKRYLSVLFFIFSMFLIAGKASAVAPCKTNCRANEGVICLERGPCQPVNDALAEAARDCREGGPAMYEPVTKLVFVDMLSHVLRIDMELPGGIEQLSEQQRYELESRLLAEKGIDIFGGTNPYDSFSREELIEIFNSVTIEDDLGVSTGMANQTLNLHNEKLVVYDPVLYVDEGNGFELWKRKENFKQSHGSDKHYVAKIDDCNNARIVFGDNQNGIVPKAGSKIKAGYKILGRQDDNVTKCEIVMLLSNPVIAGSLKDKYSPAKPLTKGNFADLLIKTMHLEKELPVSVNNLGQEELYLLKAKILARNKINIFTDSNPNTLLTREELANIFYDYPVEEIIGVSNGKANQVFGLNNSGFLIYDLHTFVSGGVKYEEWNKKNNFLESSAQSNDYVVKIDSGNYANIYFGDGNKGCVPPVNSLIKACYRLYAPLSMVNEDDIICVLGKLNPVSETYEPPPGPPEFPPPTDGFEEPASQI